MATAVRDRERLARANANGKSAVRRLLHDDDPSSTEVTDGQDSYRLAQATASKGVMPLT